MFTVHLPLVSVAYIKHTGYYVGAEADAAVKHLVSTESAEVISKIENLIFDLSEAEQMTVDDSDAARVYVFQIWLKQHLKQKGLNPTHSTKINVYTVLPKDKQVRDIFQSRQKRFRASDSIGFAPIQFDSLEEFLKWFGCAELEAKLMRSS